LDFITHDQLVKRAVHWLRTSHWGKFHCGVVLAEYRCNLGEIPDVIGFNGQRSILIECKVSRADFNKDKYKVHRRLPHGLGNYRYYLTPPDVARAEDVNNGWGLLYLTGRRITEVKASEHFTDNSVKAEEWAILYSIARRLNLRGLLKDIQEPL